MEIGKNKKKSEEDILKDMNSNFPNEKRQKEQGFSAAAAQPETLESKEVSEGEVKEKDELTLLKEKLEEKTKEAEANYDRLVRFQAEFENYKKRIWKEQQEYFKYSQESFLKDLLPVIDNFERAIKAGQNSSNTQALLEGVQLTLSQIKDILTKWGLTEIEAAGQCFDPSRHEALMVVDSDTHQDNHVVEEIEKGYLLKDRIIRPSKVIVAKKKSEDEGKE